MYIPSSTYRVQLRQDFPLDELGRILDYLASLGVSTIYAAPIGQATPGSAHGYDVTDPHRINPEVGTTRDLRDLHRVLQDKGMGWLQDIVPNHMAFNFHNVRLMDVLERGDKSPYYHYFDIDWDHPDAELKGKLMAPFLGGELHECIESGDLTIALSEALFTVNYYDNQYPVSPEALSLLAERMPHDVSDKILALASRCDEAKSFDDWHAYKRNWFKELSPDLIARIHNELESLNKDRTFLNRFLTRQHYVLTLWKETARRINYRRFFTINSLICLRMEDGSVFDEYHRFIHELFKKGFIQGVRIDHIDGLNDPAEYLRTLRALLGQDCYIIAEKILEINEAIPASWPVQGTSGYEFLSAVNKLLTDEEGSAILRVFYHDNMPLLPEYETLVLRNKKMILEQHMAGELDNIVHRFNATGLGSDLEAWRIRKSIALLMQALPVYRIYPERLPLADSEMKVMNEAFHTAAQLDPAYEQELAFLKSLCLSGDRDVQLQFIPFLRRMMQFTGPLTAKGVEDTTFYVYNPLISHDEVGDAPNTLGTSIREFHKRMIVRARQSPLSLNATATHDTKRGEDARVRLNVLSEMPDQWIKLVEHWRNENRTLKRKIGGKPAPGFNDEYFIYQSLLAGLPGDLLVSDDLVQRLKAYIIKAVREAKVMSGWEDPNQEYEHACTDFAEGILKSGSGFLKSFLPFASDVIKVAHTYSLVQLVLKVTAPGIPDIYQGCELFDLSFVDPDNRRPVDYGLRMEMLSELVALDRESFQSVIPFLRANENNGAAKLFTLWKLLTYREHHKKIFTNGVYIPLTVLGNDATAMGYTRYCEDAWCAVVVPMGIVKNGRRDKEFDGNCISLPANSPHRWRNIFTGDIIELESGNVSVSRLFSNFPVAVLTNH
jgi:(1->4)-alpha-D-glucan 1-alpha-D-glucosylmutase